MQRVIDWKTLCPYLPIQQQYQGLLRISPDGRSVERLAQGPASTTELAGNGAVARDPSAEGAPPVVLACVATRASLRRATNVVRAAALLAQRHTTLRLRVIGSVAFDEEMKLLAAALGIARRVEWVGHPLDWQAAMRDVAAGWVVADGDDAALGALDLMAHGVAVLAERTSVAARYVNHGIQGTLMATLDPPLMAAETAILLSDRGRRSAMGAAGRARVEREFPMRDMLSAFEHSARSARERGGERGGERVGAGGGERAGGRT
mgnify:CR=1 FL=1